MIAATLAFALSVSTCGPDFPARLLADRAETMSELVEGTFAHEASQLVVPAHDYVVVEGEEPPHAREHGGERERALYDAGARAFKAHDVDTAAAKWRALLRLPANERRARSTWAAYMLGRALDDASFFRQTRALVDDGFDDELGLAAASFGEEARIALEGGDVEHAVALYAEQAALGSGWGASSLLTVARKLVRDDDGVLLAHIDDPLVQRLAAAYLSTRPGEVDDAHTAHLLAAIGKRNVARFEGADMLAAAAYRAGNYDVATKFVRVAKHTPLADWVNAKLALRSGDESKADAQLLSSSAADGAIEPDARKRVEAERAVIAMHEQRYADALALLLAGGDDTWLDAAYVAERVLTTDELLAFVDAHAPKPATPPAHAYEAWVGDGSPQQRLRALLARRLVREHRFDDALAFFDDADTHAAAARYVEAMKRAGDRSVRIDEKKSAVDVDAARDLFAAASEMRKHGMEIAGTELDPDWAVFGGAFDLGEQYDTDEDGFVRKDVVTPASGTPYVTDDEVKRAQSTRAEPYERFHYRAVAANLVDVAADLVPARSQAFAAMLCAGSSFVGGRDPDRAGAFWSRYVKNGAVVDGMSFGNTCPAPDFERARALHRSMSAWHVKAPRKRVIARDAALLLLLVAFTSLGARALVRSTVSVDLR